LSFDVHYFKSTREWPVALSRRLMFNPSWLSWLSFAQHICVIWLFSMLAELAKVCLAYICYRELFFITEGGTQFTQSSCLWGSSSQISGKDQKLPGCSLVFAHVRLNLFYNIPVGWVGWVGQASLGNISVIGNYSLSHTEGGIQFTQCSYLWGSSSQISGKDQKLPGCSLMFAHMRLNPFYNILYLHGWDLIILHHLMRPVCPCKS
jgi:hypothetical protein